MKTSIETLPYSPSYEALEATGKTMVERWIRLALDKRSHPNWDSVAGIIEEQIPVELKERARIQTEVVREVLEVVKEMRDKANKTDISQARAELSRILLTHQAAPVPDNDNESGSEEESFAVQEGGSVIPFGG